MNIPTPIGTHAHRWILDEPHGPTSSGACRICGAHREFRNWLWETDFTTMTERELVA